MRLSPFRPLDSSVLVLFYCRSCNGARAVAWIEDLYFSVELRQPGGSVEEVLARCAGILIAQAAYKAARTQYPNRLIMLCLQAQIVERSDEDR